MQRMHHAQLDCHAKNSSGMTLATWAHGPFRQTNETLGKCGMMTKPKGNASNLAGTARATRLAQEATIADARTTLQIRHGQCDSPAKKTQVARHERPGPTANSARRTKKLSECGMATKRGGMKTKLTGALKTWRSLAGPKRSRPAGPRGDASTGANSTAAAIRR